MSHQHHDDAPPTNINKDTSTKAKPPVRHAEKRRTSTCRFADRVARISIEHYRRHVPAAVREAQPQTCLAAIVAFVQQEDHDKSFSGSLHVVGMGVGTKYLAHAALQSEFQASSTSTPLYGTRVRDAHAEVLARRAFQRHLLWEIASDLEINNRDDNYASKHDQEECDNVVPMMIRILERAEETTCSHETKKFRYRYRLKPGVSLHFYSSSAPCGNATLKKFATMKQETFRDIFGEDEWPKEPHPPMVGHSFSLGQFALLVKKDASAMAVETTPPISKKQKTWPLYQSTTWCPPGTTTVWSNRGSLHTCSDKLCRWNCLGLQGSLLASLLEMPLHMETLTVGRKLTACICQRAVCCRAEPSNCHQRKKKHKQQPSPSNNMQASSRQNNNGNAGNGSNCHDDQEPLIAINHPTILGSAVYMDEHGVIDMSAAAERGEGQDVRFHNSLSWAWWPAIEIDDNDNGDDTCTTITTYTTSSNNNTDTNMAEAIDGSMGYAIINTAIEEAITDQNKSRNNPVQCVSRISTRALTRRYLQIIQKPHKGDKEIPAMPHTLTELRAFKQQMSPDYEAQKDVLLTKHPVLGEWKRRQSMLSLP